MLICKCCFKGFTGLNKKSYLTSHHQFCNTNTLSTPIMPSPNTILKFKNWGRTQRHPISIFADFESLLIKQVNNGSDLNTKITHIHELMSYCYYVKVSDDVQINLLDQFDMPKVPIIHRGEKYCKKEEVSEHFVQNIIKLAKNIEQMLKTNIDIIMTPENVQNHNFVKN